MSIVGQLFYEIYDCKFEISNVRNVYFLRVSLSPETKTERHNCVSL